MYRHRWIYYTWILWDTDIYNIYICIHIYIYIPLIFSGSYKSSSRLGKLKTSTSSRPFKKVLKSWVAKSFFQHFRLDLQLQQSQKLWPATQFSTKKNPPPHGGTLWICPAAHQIALQSRESLQLQMYRHPWPLSGRPDQNPMRPLKSRRCVEKRPVLREIKLECKTDTISLSKIHFFRPFREVPTCIPAKASFVTSRHPNLQPLRKGINSSHLTLQVGRLILLMEEILHQSIGSLSHERSYYLQGLLHPRWLSGFLPSSVVSFF